MIAKVEGPGVTVQHPALHLPSDVDDPHWSDALVFLAALKDTADATVMFQTFDDAKAGRCTPEWFPGTFRASLRKLIAVNRTAGGIFVMVNDGTARNKGGVTAVRAVWGDVDVSHWLADKQAEFNRDDFLGGLPLAPSIAVQTSGQNLQLYWLVDGCTPEQCQDINKAICDAVDSDKGAVEWSRVLRVPGFYHQKDAERPQMVRLLYANPRTRFTVEQLRAAFPSADVPSRPAPVPTRKPAPSPAPAYTVGTTPWGRTVMEEEMYVIAKTPEGARNAAITRGAFKMGQAVPHELDEGEALAALFDAADACGSLGDNAKETTSTIERQLAVGKQRPRYPTERTPQRTSIIQAAGPAPGQPVAARNDVKSTAPRNQYTSKSAAEDRYFTLDDAAYHGPIGKFVRDVTPHTEGDPVAILVQMLTSFGSIVGASPHFMVEGTRHPLLLFCAIVGNTARARKGTSLGRVKQVTRKVDERWMKECQLAGGLASGQGLISRVRDPGEEKDKEGNPVAAGVDDKRLLVVEEELSKVWKIRKQETSTVTEVLRQAWDGEDLHNHTVRDGGVHATRPHISLIGHITRAELNSTMDNADVFNGVANRFLWCFAARTQLLPRGGREFNPDSTVSALVAAAKFGSHVGRMDLTDEAWAVWDDLYLELEEETGTVLDSILARSSPYVLRIAAIYALADRQNMVDVCHLAAALAVWRYCRHSARVLFGGRPPDAVASKVLNHLRRHPDGLSRTEISDHLNGREKAETIDRCRDYLVGMEAIRVDARASGGRPLEWWTPVL